MKSNLGYTDRTVRVILAVLITGAGLYFRSWWGLVALVPLATALTSFCPVYKFLGLNTCPDKSVQ